MMYKQSNNNHKSNTCSSIQNNNKSYGNDNSKEGESADNDGNKNSNRKTTSIGATKILIKAAKTVSIRAG